MKPYPTTNHLVRCATSGVALFCMLIMLVAGGAQAYTPLAQPAPDDEITPGPPAAWDIEAESLTPPGAPNAIEAEVVPTDCLGSPTRQIRYTSDGVIHLAGCGQTFTLSDVAAAPAVGPTRLELVDPANKIWLLKVNLKVEEGATLRVVGGAAGDANWLRLRSDPAGGLWLRGENGNLLFQDTRVTSWDTAAGTFDTDVTVGSNGSGGRSYIHARSLLTKGRATTAPTACTLNGGSQEPYEGRLDVINSELAYLGYNAAESYGVTWKVNYKTDPADPNDQPPPGRQLYALVDVFGTVTGSSFNHNYFGAYTYGAYCMRWTGNTFAGNHQYGLDPHDDSDSLTIDGNIFRDNGNHGVICSVECSDIVITNNQSYNNLHGIMIHRNVNAARVEGNDVHDNRGDGIALFDSHDAVVRNNTVVNNATSAVRLSVGSSGNLIENNTLTGLAANATGSGYVVYMYQGSDPPASGDGLPKNNTLRNNRLTGYKSPMLRINDATGNLFEANTILGPANDAQFRAATANRLRDSEIGKPLQIVLDSSSTAALEDSRNYVWQLSRSGLSTRAGPTGSRLDLNYANTGGSITATTIELAVKPQNGEIAVQPGVWDSANKGWQESSGTTTGAVAHMVGALQAGACYSVTAGGVSLGNFIADSAGRISFSYAGGYSNTVSFVVAGATGCGTTAPTPTATPPTQTPPTSTPTTTPPAQTPTTTPIPTPPSAPQQSIYLPLISRG